MSPHELQPYDALTYINGGRGKATLIGAENRYTYKFSCPKDHGCVWVSTLTGSDNENDYHYIGFIPNGSVRLAGGRKGNPNHPAYKALDWYINKAFHNPEAASKATFMHEGICGRCGRTLTVPESIEKGIGPVCEGRANGE